jgi:hypothetical protein
MKVQFSLCAQSISIDQFSSRLSVFNVLEHVIVPSFPIFFPELTFVALVRADDRDDLESTIQRVNLIVSQADRILAQSVASMRFGGGPIARLIFNFSGLAIYSPVDLDFNLHMPTGEVHSLKIPVSQVSLPMSAQKQSESREPVGKLKSRKRDR